MNNLESARTAVTDLQADLAQIDERIRDLEVERAGKQADLERAGTILLAATAEAQAVAREPQDRLKLAELSDRLRQRLAAAPSYSPTAKEVRGQLGRLDDERATVADRLALAKGLLSELANHYQRDREVWDRATPHMAGREPRR